MSSEKRNAPRISLVLDVQWVTNGTVTAGTISDISLTGCFILAGGDPRPGAPVWINVRLPHNEQQSVLFGEIMYVFPEIGFAVEFVRFSDEDTRFLNYLISYFETEAKLQL